MLAFLRQFRLFICQLCCLADHNQQSSVVESPHNITNVATITQDVLQKHQQKVLRLIFVVLAEMPTLKSTKVGKSVKD
jgi:hypothetical protein